MSRIYGRRSFTILGAARQLDFVCFAARSLGIKEIFNLLQIAIRNTNFIPSKALPPLPPTFLPAVPAVIFLPSESSQPTISSPDHCTRGISKALLQAACPAPISAWSPFGLGPLRKIKHIRDGNVLISAATQVLSPSLPHRLPLIRKALFRKARTSMLLDPSSIPFLRVRRRRFVLIAALNWALNPLSLSGRCWRYHHLSNQNLGFRRASRIAYQISAMLILLCLSMIWFMILGTNFPAFHRATASSFPPLTNIHNPGSLGVLSIQGILLAMQQSIRQSYMITIPEMLTRPKKEKLFLKTHLRQADLQFNTLALRTKIHIATAIKRIRETHWNLEGDCRKPTKFQL